MSEKTTTTTNSAAAAGTAGGSPFPAARPLFEGGPLFHSLPALAAAGFPNVDKLPVTLRIVLEALLRNCGAGKVAPEDVAALANWRADATGGFEIPFPVARVVLQDFTGVPLLADLAAMRSAAARLGADPRRVEPLVPVDLVVDHSVQVDCSGGAGALGANLALEFKRNRERYQFLKWGAGAFKTFRVTPPATGIVHQVNLERLATVVAVRGGAAFPDSLVGTDSHTTMINGLGVLGWGVGGIEAEAAMLGEPVTFLAPEVVGVELAGALPAGATATDLALRVTEALRREKVVGAFVEFFGAGAAALPVPDRATLANMAPEYGATTGFFGVDEKTLDYLRATGRSPEQCALVERYFKEQGLWGIARGRGDAPAYSRVLTLDLAATRPCVAGPRRPQDRIELPALKSGWSAGLTLAPAAAETSPEATAPASPALGALRDGSVVIASITSCTNTSNPSVMVAAGLLARNARRRGLRPPAFVKTSLAPGSRAVTAYLGKLGLDADLDALGFQTVGYGCATCIGNSGPLLPGVEDEIKRRSLAAAAVLSGNRNFEARVHQSVKAAFLASPPLVVAFALAGTVAIDLDTEPLGTGTDGAPVFLRDIWPDAAEVAAAVASAVTPDVFAAAAGTDPAAAPLWDAVPAPQGLVYAWDANSTYIQEPPFFADFRAGAGDANAAGGGGAGAAAGAGDIRGARALAVLGDSVTTDHISPAGAIKPDSPAGRYLREHGVAPADFNSYGSRRGNDRVMTRGTFANVRIRNLLAPGTEGGVTVFFGTGGARETLPIFDAAERYRAAGVPLVVVAGEDYGMGSSRDWAAKGTALLGARAVIAKSFERIHRSNLVGMGVLPLVFADKDDHARVLDALRAGATLDLVGIAGDALAPRCRATLRVNPTAAAGGDVVAAGGAFDIPLLVRIDTPAELGYYRAGGILPDVLAELLK
ncbi:MAG: aconitate hydratase AcnA [Puniceicoccales bacterium]|jgi:aconitate hydratase|nr:aconitate hydratase AcnA [Puniceicoccales bacterium]